MTPAAIDLAIYQGATFTKVFSWTENGSLKDLTAFTARMQIRAKKADADPLHSMTTENGGIALGGALGTVTLNITATATAGFNFASAVYDLELVSGSTVYRFAQGAVSLDKEVTR
jgi:hypothetical protein